MTVRRCLWWALLLALLATAAAGGWRSVRPEPPSVTAIAAQLRCPACQGESVAQSQSPTAAAMRDTIAQQLAAGRNAEQIQHWFVQRYGPDILVDPAHGPIGALLWLVPLATAALAGLLLVRARRRRVAQHDHPSPRRTPGTTRQYNLAATAVVLLVAVIAVTAPGGADDEAPADTLSTTLAVARSMEDAGRYAEAAGLYEDALRQRPDDRIRIRLAFTLIRCDRAGDAVTIARAVADREPADLQAVLVLGLAQRAAGDPAAADTLRRFLAAAPDDPSADQVRRLLAAS
ncbi:cytochrome c-type biogenesis protein CcmH [Dactylosporangium aurantiacum]|uniref:Cytochrome c-type biogenesis protein n=1 Tax=Dactylosporangium aurantiacum TaxID=35754 RepID=A0A9Q9MJ59_9ACTN|nr:cytochrome c-type biogenesis protein CcmH [Dactylosporangium aurantiacum]MDG6110500.1 cytochrome c-type biogenesis protein CcmH [Dactylosporangium aurantiacum]UWZ58644.1 cytochrome c-type biogenesis protein CcmH [Dactylosporangium aurantiacum]